MHTFWDLNSKRLVPPKTEFVFPDAYLRIVFEYGIVRAQWEIRSY